MTPASDRTAEASIPADVHVRYRATDALGEDALNAAVALLSSEERARHERFRVERDRREFAVAHALLRTTLSQFGGLPPDAWRFDSGPHGKPVLAHGVSRTPLAFNLSHARGLVACVVVPGAPGARGSDVAAATREVAVGLDVECVTRSTDWRGIASRYFSRAEIGQIDRVTEDAQATRFFELWTLKEAFAKALGLGLSQALDATTFELERTGAIACTLPPEVAPAAWYFALYTPTPTHRLAVAVSDGTARRWGISVQRGEGAGERLAPSRTSED